MITLPTELSSAISNTGLPPTHQRSLNKLVEQRNYPLFVGYLIVCFGGLFVLAATTLAIYNAYVSAILPQRDIAQMGYLVAAVLKPLLIGGAICSVGASYLARIRASRAVTALLLRK